LSTNDHGGGLAVTSFGASTRLLHVGPGKYRDGVSYSDGQTTSVFHQATEANSASYPQWNGK